MSYTFLQGQAEESSAECFSDIGRFAPSNLAPTAEASYCKGSGMEFCHAFQSGMTSEHLTLGIGAEGSMQSAAVSHASASVQQLEAGLLRKTSGRKCSGSLKKRSQLSFLPKMFLAERLKSPPKTLSIWVTKPKGFPLPRLTWVLTTKGQDIGYLHTPTCTANYAAPSMQKWPCAQAFVRVFGKPTPTNHEWLMGWPIGWTDLRPLETAKFQSWLQLHGDFLIRTLNKQWPGDKEKMG